MLVVETVNFYDAMWLTDDGAFRRRDLKIIERLRPTGDTLESAATVRDPAVLAKPWVLTPRAAYLTDPELVAAPPCIDRAPERMVDDSHHKNPR
jgi:hypothetical protein